MIWSSFGLNCLDDFFFFFLSITEWSSLCLHLIDMTDGMFLRSQTQVFSLDVIFVPLDVSGVEES